MKYWKSGILGLIVLIIIAAFWIDFNKGVKSERETITAAANEAKEAGLIALAGQFLRESHSILERLPERTGADMSMEKTAKELSAKVINIAILISEALEHMGEDQVDSVDGIFQGTIAKGDTMDRILRKVTDKNTHVYTKAAAKVFSVKSFREGQPYTIIIDPDTRDLIRFEYEIDNARRLVVEGAEKPKAWVEPIEHDLMLVSIQGVIDDNLFKAVTDIGESPQLALGLVKLFGSEINFIKDIKPGDSFSVLIEKKYKDGQYRGYGRILAATFTNNKKKYEAYLFNNDGKTPDNYYNSKGENLQKTLLQAPLAVTRMTSNFSQNRFHPILGFSRPHLGVDYGAPMGTPVKSVGDGVVKQFGWAGGYGYQVIIKHGGGLESMYSHLSGFRKGLKEGQHVRQGQVIGFVGSTGLSTGPHLDFRLLQKGEFINPAKAINPRGAPVSAPDMKKFKRVMENEKAHLEGKKIASNYVIDSIVPLAVLSDLDEENVEQETPAVAGGRKAKTRAPRHSARYINSRLKILHSRSDKAIENANLTRWQQKRKARREK